MAQTKRNFKTYDKARHWVVALPKQQSTKIKMSNSLNKKLRGKTIKIFGPPGTGKTENLLETCTTLSQTRLFSDEICYISFTNKAVNECVSRVRKKFKEYDEDDFKYFRTLHSLARQQFAEIPVLDPKADLLMFHTQYGTVKLILKTAMMI